MMTDRFEKQLLSGGFIVVGLCLLTIALLVAIVPVLRAADALLGLSSVMTGLVRFLNDRTRKGPRINF